MTRERVLSMAGQDLARLIDLPADGERRLTRSLGADPATGVGEVALEIRRLAPTAVPLARIGRDDAAWRDDGTLFLLDRGQRTGIRAATGTEPIVAELAGTSDLAIVRALALMALLQRGIVPVHAAVAAVGDQLLGVGGWSRGGKTTGLVAVAAAGAVPIGAEWLYLLPDGTVRVGRHRVRLRPEHLRSSATLVAGLSTGTKRRLAAIGRIGSAVGSAGAVPGAGGRVIRRTAAWLERHAHVDAPAPDAAPLDRAPRPLAALVLVVDSVGEPGARHLPTDEVAERLTAAFEEDVAAAFAADRRYRFAFGRPLLSEASSMAPYRRLIEARLATTPTWEVRRGTARDPSQLADHLLEVLA
jgi:hypothetical protein